MPERPKPQQPQAFVNLVTGSGEKKKESELKTEIQALYKQAEKILSTYGIQKRGFVTYTAGPYMIRAGDPKKGPRGEEVGTEYKKHPLYQVTRPVKIIIDRHPRFLTLAKEKNEEEIKLRLSQTKKLAMNFNFGILGDMDVLCTILPMTHPIFNTGGKITGISPDKYRPGLPGVLNFIEKSLRR